MNTVHLSITLKQVKVHPDGLGTSKTLNPPVRLGDVPPVRSGEVPPVRSGEVPPVRSGEVPPVRLGDVPPVRSGEVPPVRLGDVPPVRLGDVPPVRQTLLFRGPFKDAPGSTLAIMLYLRAHLRSQDYQ